MPEVRCETCRHVIPVKRYIRKPGTKYDLAETRYECATRKATVQAADQCENWKELGALPCF